MSTNNFVITDAKVTVNAPKPTIARTVAYKNAIAVVDMKHKLVSISPIMRTEIKNKKIFERGPVKAMTRKTEGTYMVYCEVDADEDENMQLTLMESLQDALEACFSHNKVAKKGAVK